MALTDVHHFGGFRMELSSSAGEIANRYLIWAVFPNHHQMPFFQALRAEGVDLEVCYYEPVHQERLELGWSEFSKLPPKEQFVPKTVESLKCIPDWRDRIHVVPGCGDPFLRKLALTLSRQNVPWIHWSEPSRPGLRRLAGLALKRWYGRLINRHALGAIGIGKNAIDDFRRWGVRVEKMAMVPYSSAEYDLNGPKDATIEIFCADGHPVFLFPGALCHRKGIDILLKAFAKLEARGGSEPKLVLVGNDRSGGRYQLLAKSLNIEQSVLFRGPVPPTDLGLILRCGDVLCLPSRADGWGVVLNEGASMGLALIASDAVGAANHLIEPGQNGYRTKVGDIESLSSAMQAYVNDPQLAKRHGERSRRLFQDYTPQRNAERFLNAVASFQAMGKQR